MIPALTAGEMLAQAVQLAPLEAGAGASWHALIEWSRQLAERLTVSQTTEEDDEELSASDEPEPTSATVAEEEPVPEQPPTERASQSWLDQEIVGLASEHPIDINLIAPREFKTVRDVTDWLLQDVSAWLYTACELVPECEDRNLINRILCDVMSEHGMRAPRPQPSEPAQERPFHDVVRVAEVFVEIHISRVQPSNARRSAAAGLSRRRLQALLGG